jgi:lipoprotein-anchoring transpeptidase ErfK/SrfK
MQKVWVWAALSFLAAAVTFAVLVLERPASVLSAHGTAFASATTTAAAEEKVAKKPQYIEVTASCGPYYGGTCIRARSGPGVDYPVVAKLRNGMVLRTSGMVIENGQPWYKIEFDEWLRYPDRVQGDMYVAAEYVDTFSDEGQQELVAGAATPQTDKHILIDRSDQMLYAYEGKELFMEEPISTGLELTPTPRGTFTVYRKTPTRYMQGPIPGISDQEYDLPGVPWNLYFTLEGGAIHGAYWHDHFGEPWSHGCVNMPPPKAKELYEWAPIGTKVVVRD